MCRRIREIHYHLEFWDVLLGMCREITCQSKSISDYGRQMCVYCFSSCSVQLLISCQNRNTWTHLCAAVFMHSTSPLISSVHCPLRYQIMTHYGFVVIINWGIVVLQSLTAVRSGINIYQSHINIY